MSEAKCYVKGKELEEAKRAFTKILKKIEKSSSRSFDFRKEFATVKALCEIVEYTYMINDYQASCMAYMYTLPRINDLMKYVTEQLSHKKGRKKGKKPDFDLEEWVLQGDETTSVRQADGSTTKYSRMEYLYGYLKDRQMAIAARYFIHWNINYLEKEKVKKSYPVRERILRSAVWWANQMMLKKFGLRMPDAPEELDIKPRMIIFSTFPSSGKSFLCNTTNEMFSELSSIITKRGGVLRVSNEQSNIFRQSQQTMNLIENPLIFNIYPENKKFINPKSNKYNPFSKSAEEEWGLMGCAYTPNTSIFKTRDSAINSIRCELGMFDDPSRGLQESNNVQIHQNICTLFNGDFRDRFESADDIAILLTGTMYNPFDVFSTEIQKALRDGAIKDNRFDNTYLSKDKKVVVIVNDCENEIGESAYPELISTEELKNKRESLPAYEYHCIWRQKPIPAEGLIFSKEFLRFYDKRPDDLTPHSFAVIDPTRRKAKDFFSMPIFKRQDGTDDYYLVDIIFEKKSSMDLMPKIIERIINNRITKIYFEENINDTLGSTIRKELEKHHIKFCEIIPIYNTVNKMQRIADMEHAIKQHIVFPSEKVAPSVTPLGYAMHQLYEYNGEKSEHDDMPDSLAMFAAQFIVYPVRRNVIRASTQFPY